MSFSAAEDNCMTDTSIRGIVKSLADRCVRTSGLGSMSVAIYDTAWLAMVSRDIDGVTSWTFPECFKYVLDNQFPDGGWESYASPIDGILNTIGGLLALLKRSRAAESMAAVSAKIPGISNYDSHILRAKKSLHLQLQSWDVDTCDHVGFEYLVPALLNMLATYEVEFTFPGMQKLMAMNAVKLAVFDPKHIYGPMQSTALHSLEAFVGIIDFDRVSHHKVNGSIMASPASTAAYLMFRSEWDVEAEIYLKEVIANGVGKGNGGVPSAFPTTIFEISWVLSALLKAGFTPSSLGVDSVEVLSRFIDQELHAGNGILGFAPQLLPDADDTAKSISTLSLLGKPSSLERMVTKFECQSHFKTYDFERNPSFSVNCNVLDAVLHDEDPHLYHKQIAKIIDFLCNSWNSGDVSDKWNLSSQYPMMLLAQTFRKLLMPRNHGKLSLLPSDETRDRVVLVLFQVIYRTLARQNGDGSWGMKASCEETAYAILTLADASNLKLCWGEKFDNQMYKAIKLAKVFLAIHQDTWGQGSYTWIEKVSYKSKTLSTVYSTAAYRVATGIVDATQSSTMVEVHVLGNYPQKVSTMTDFFSRIPLFKTEPMWKLEASVIEGLLHLPKLRQIRLDVFPRTDMGDDKYLDYIPFTWTACNSKADFPLNPAVAWDMMVISMLNYQVDEFMETIKDIHSIRMQNLVRAKIDKLFEEYGYEPDAALTPSSSDSEEALNLNKVTRSALEAKTDHESSTEAALQRFVRHVLEHPDIIKAASPHALIHLSDQLRKFLLAHVDHSSDNSVLAQQLPQSSIPAFSSKRSFYDWIHGTSAINTSCPYSFTWLMCRIGQESDAFSNAMTRYLGQDLAQHLAAMCRMYNDIGSLARDIAEGNLNSLHFPEFQSLVVEKRLGGSSQWDFSSAKRKLMELAEFERSRVLMTKANLLPLLSKEEGDIVGVFVDVTDLYGQIYVARDIATRLR